MQPPKLQQISAKSLGVDFKDSSEEYLFDLKGNSLLNGKGEDDGTKD